MSEIQKQLEIKELVDNTPVREKLLELKNWEKTMKVKEKELKLNNNNKPEPIDSLPIRSRVKENGTTTMNGDGDHHAFQDEDCKSANAEKERGNKLVSLKDYTNALTHYTKAIEFNAKDPAFYMNRALCYLRLERYPQAISDCDSALALDKSLTKAFFRRMQSHIHLENYDAALGDCIQMIKLDAGNASLRKEFDRIRQLKVDKETAKSGSNVLAASPKPVEEPHWEPRPKKLWSKFGADEEEILFQDKAPHLRSKKPLKRIPITETFSKPEPVEKIPDEIVDKLFNNFTGESTSNGPVASTSRSPTTLFSPYTPLYGSFNAPKSPSAVVIGAPPSPMSSSALNLSSCSADRSIDDIFGGMSVSSSKDTQEPEEGAQLQLPLANTMLDDKTDVMKPITVAPSPNQATVEYSLPRNGVQFANTWKSLDEGQRFHYLRQVQQSKPEIVSKLGASLDDSLLTEMLDCLNSYFCPKDLNIGDILQQLSGNEEMSILRIMMSGNDKETLGDLLTYVKSRRELSDEQFDQVEQVLSV